MHQKRTTVAFKDITNQVFGRLTALSRAPNRPPIKKAFWNCRCQCGAEIVVCGSELRYGNTQSCGCLQKERASQATRTHGHCGRGGKDQSKTYGIWNTMLGRCINPNVEKFGDYGGRGITVCDRWRLFENFLADMGEKPIGKSLDRIDNEGNYEPKNCRWATRLEQATNTRRTLRITHNGETLCWTEWRRKFNVSEGGMIRILIDWYNQKCT